LAGLRLTVCMALTVHARPTKLVDLSAPRGRAHRLDHRLRDIANKHRLEPLQGARRVGTVHLKRRRALVPVPFFVWEIQAALLGILPNVPFARDQVTLMRRNYLVSDTALIFADLSIRHDRWKRNSILA
jgi:hypothetical protein